jgi:hypothetical protein
VRVADAVEAVATNVETTAQVAGQRILARASRQRRVIRSIENRNVYGLRIDLAGTANGRQGRRVVQRCQMTQLVELGQDSVVDPRRLYEAFAAMDHAMDDCARRAMVPAAFTELL